MAFDAILVVFANAYMAARSRAAGSPSRTVRLMAELDEADLMIDLAEREPRLEQTPCCEQTPRRFPERATAFRGRSSPLRCVPHPLGHHSRSAAGGRADA